MISHPGNVQREAWIRKHFNRVARFKIVLACAGFVWKLPGGNLVVDERIIERFRNFMTESGHVLETGKNAGRDPAGKGKNPTRFPGNSGVCKERVKAQSAAASHTAFSIERKEKSVRE